MLTGILLTARVSVADTQTLPSLQEIATAIGLDQKAIDDVMAGKMVRPQPRDHSERDLAAGFVFLVKATPQQIAAGVRSAYDFTADPTIVASQRIVTNADFAALRLEPKGDEEAKRYLTAEPGDTLNLSTTELAAFRALGDKATRADVEATLRRVLQARLGAYRARGLDGIEPYTRGKDQVMRPADDLRRAGRLLLLERYAPGFRALLANYPTGRPADLDEAFYWVVYAQDNRPTVTLRHRFSMPVAAGMLMLDREIYVSQGHNCTQSVAAFLPVDGGTIVFYLTHTSTDRVAGPAGAAKHGIGRRMMGNQLEKIFETMRKRPR